MKNFRRLCITVLLTAVFTIPALAGETNTPPCNPGETNSPPCSEGGFTAQGDTQGPSVALTGEIGCPGVLGDVLTPGFVGTLLGFGIY